MACKPKRLDWEEIIKVGKFWKTDSETSKAEI
jgi:hypothetical protein